MQNYEDLFSRLLSDLRGTVHSYVYRASRFRRLRGSDVVTSRFRENAVYAKTWAVGRMMYQPSRTVILSWPYPDFRDLEDAFKHLNDSLDYIADAMKGANEALLDSVRIPAEYWGVANDNR